jgi:hypothetical protein
MLDVEEVVATDPIGVPAGGRPSAIRQMGLLVLVDGVVANEREGQ